MEIDKDKVIKSGITLDTRAFISPTVKEIVFYYEVPNEAQ